jgi:Flp pilus assembly protein TadG
VLGRDFSRDERGATAVEMAFVAPIVIALMVATIEIGALEVVSTNLDSAVLVATRKIRTGAADRPTSAQGFVDAVCANMSDNAATCRSRLSISVQKVASFAGAPAAATATPAGQFDASGPGDIVVVQAVYRFPLVLPMYAGGFQLAGPNEAQLDARAAFRNEPYG